MSADKAASPVLCDVCGARCRWVEEAWVCTRRSCGAEWYPDHGPKYSPPAPMTDSTASPVPTVRDLYGFSMVPAGDATSYVSANHLLALLGIDPELPVETVQRRLLIGERVEKLTPTEMSHVYGAEALVDYLTRQDNTDSSVSP